MAIDGMPVEMQQRVRMLGGNPLTEAQETLAADAYRRDPVSFERALASAATSQRPTAYFVSATRKICAEALAKSAYAPSRPQRHDLEPVACRDCGDTGFVVLIRDVGAEAQAGDAAPCHCETGQLKQARYGTTHYVMGDFEPAVPDPTVPLMSFQEYAQSEAGLNDPHLAGYARLIQTKEMP